MILKFVFHFSLDHLTLSNSQPLKTTNPSTLKYCSCYLKGGTFLKVPEPSAKSFFADTSAW